MAVDQTGAGNSPEESPAEEMLAARGPFHHAVVVCTRNRPEDLRRLMESLETQECERPFLTVVVDASDPDYAASVRAAVASVAGVPVMLQAYPGKPSAARQRNYGIDRLPQEVDIVHFVDDDVSLETNYLETLTSLLDSQPEVGGVGGHVIISKSAKPMTGWKRLVRRLFLLESAEPGRVLPSGAVTPAQSISLPGPVEVDCLASCSASYRRQIVADMRFDDRLDTHSMDEDFDLSYRVSRVARLVVEPKARLVHHVSDRNRPSIRELNSDMIVHRYWFLEKNIRHPLRKPAFWWKVFGSFVITSLSRNPDAGPARRGILDGVRTVWRRSHPLLQGIRS